MRFRIRRGTSFIVMVSAAVTLSCGSQTSVQPRAQTCDERLRGIIEYLWGSPSTAVPGDFVPGLIVVEQDYEPSDDESGYTLGPESTRTVQNATEVSEFLSALRQRVGERGPDVGKPRDASGTEWSAQLARNSRRETGVFCGVTLEVGDVEHVLVIQFDGGTGRPVAAYAN